MRRVQVVGLALIALLLLLLAPTVSAQGPDGGNLGGVVFSGSRTIGEGQTYSGDMAVFGGDLTVRGTVTGNLAVFGGSVVINGTVQGNVIILGGSVQLREGSRVRGEVNRLGGSLEQSPGAAVGPNAPPLQPTAPTAPGAPTPPRAPSAPTVQPRNPILAFLGWVLRTALLTIGLAVLGVVAMLLLPVQMRNVADTIRINPAAATGMGALTWVVWVAAIILVALVSALLMIICVGLLGIPVLIVLAVAFPVAVLFGWLATGYLVGESILRALRIQTNVPLMAAGIGVLVITGVHQVVDLVPCLGGLLSWLLTLPGLGAVVLTWFGTRAWRPGDPYLPGGIGPRSPMGPVPPAPGWSPPLILDAGPTTPTAPPAADVSVWGQTPATPAPAPNVEVDQTAPPTPPLVDEPVPPPSPWTPPKTAGDLLSQLEADASETPPPAPPVAIAPVEPPSPWAPRPSATPRPTIEESQTPPAASAPVEPPSPWAPRPNATPRPAVESQTSVQTPSEPPSPWARRATTTPPPMQAASPTTPPPPAVEKRDAPSSPWAPPPGRQAAEPPEALRASPLSPFYVSETRQSTPSVPTEPTPEPSETPSAATAVTPEPTEATPVPPEDTTVPSEVKLVTPVPTQRDNLQRLPLVGPTYEGLFNSRGVYGYAQVAALSLDELKAMLSGPNVISVSESQAQMMIDEAKRLSGT